MKYARILLIVVFGLCLSGFTSAIHARFRNLLPFTVSVELKNTRGDVYQRIVLYSGAIGTVPVTSGVARVFDQSGREVSVGSTVKPSDIQTFYDFKHRAFYYDIRTKKIIPVVVQEGRRWP